MLIEISNGEIVDKLTIIEIKLSRIDDPNKRKNLEAELAILNAAVSKIIEKDKKDVCFNAMKKSAFH